MTNVTAVWTVVQYWLDQQQFPPNQSKLGDAVGVGRSAVSDWKRGKSHPSPENLEKLAKLMEPTLGPRTYTLLVLAVTSDMGFGQWVGWDAKSRRLPGDVHIRRDASGDGDFIQRLVPQGSPARKPRRRLSAVTDELPAAAKTGAIEEPGENSI